LQGDVHEAIEGVEQTARKDLLKRLQDGDMSFGDLAKSCKYAKSIRKVQASFMSLLNIGNWDEATKLHPDYTTKETLEPFLKLSFKPSAPVSFIAFCQQAKQSSLAPTATESSNCMYVKDTIASVVKFDVLHDETRSVLAATPSQFTGVHLTIVDPPKVTIIKIHHQN
jgi:hypothetical protein